MPTPEISSNSTTANTPINTSFEEPKINISQNNQKEPKIGPKSSLGLILFSSFFSLVIGLIVGLNLKNFSSSFLAKFPSKSSPSPSPKEKLKIGVILPLTGDAASYGIPMQQTLAIAQKEVNQQGGIDGREVELIWKDGRCEKNDAQTAAEQLINEEKVEFLLGGACSSEFLSSAPIAQAKKIITFSSSATSPKISTLGKYVFRTCPSDALAGKAAAGYAYNQWKAKTAGVIAENKDYTQALKEVFVNEFSQLGGEIILNESFPSGTTDFSELALKVKTSSPDVIYILPQSPTPGVLLVKALKSQGIKSKILTAEVLLIRDAIAEQGEILEGVTGIEVLFDETKPKAKHLLTTYKNEYNLEPTYPGFMAGIYDIIYLIKEAYESGAKTSDEIANYLYNLKDWEGAVGKLQFDSHGDPTMTYSIRKITNSTAIQVDTYTPSP